MQRPPKAALALSGQTANTQLRPYVYVASESIEIGSTVGLISNIGKASVTIQNYGQTPAKNVTLQARCFIGGHWTDDFPAELDDVALIHIDDMPPGFHRTKDVYYVTGIVAAQAEIRNAQATIFFEGLISYTDAAGQACQTRFRRACMGDDLHRGAFITTGHGNGAT